jgi:PAS domain S-box-containing protein
MQMKTIEKKQAANTKWYSPVVDRRIGRTIWLLLTLILVISFLDLLGWVGDFSLLKSLGRHWVAMKIVTAGCFILTASALAIIHKRLPGQYRSTIPRFLGLIIMLTGLLTIIEYIIMSVSGREVFFADFPVMNIFFDPDRRMALLTAIIFFLTGIVIILLATGREKAGDYAHIVAIPASVGSYIIMLSYLLGVQDLREIMNKSVAFNTGIAFCLTCVVVYLLNPNSRMMKVFSGKLSGSIMARILLPWIFILPLCIAGLRTYGERIGLFSSEFGVALVALAYTLCFLCLIWFTARLVNRTDQKRWDGEEALRNSERLYRAIGESIDYGVWVCDPQGRNIYASDSYLKLVGITQEQCSNFGWGDTLHPEDSERTIAAWKECVRTGGMWDIEHRFKGTDGKWHPILARGIPVRDDQGQIISWVGINLDISKIKNTEDALRESQARTIRVLENIADTFYSLDDQWRFTLINPAAEKAPFGRPASELLGKVIWDEYPGLVGTEIYQHYINAARNHSLENYLSKSPLNGRWYEVFMQGRQGGVDVYMRDINKRKEAEESLRASEQRLNFHFENSPLAVVEWDSNFIVTRWSNEAERIFGWKAKETVGKPLDNINMVYEEDIPIVVHTMEQLSRGEEKIIVSSNRNLTKSGDVRICVWYNSVLTDESGRMSSVMSLVLDITEQKKGELLIKRNSEKLDILSQTAGRLLESDDPQKLINELCFRVMNFLDCQVLINFLVDENAGKLKLNTYAGVPEKKVKLIQWLDFGVAMCGAVAESGERIIAENIPEVNDPRTTLVKSIGVRAYACHPLLSQGKVIGTLSFGTTTRMQFSEDDISMMKAISDLVSIALARTRNSKELQDTKNYLENLINYANAPIIVWNPAFEIQVFNKAFENLTGYASEEVKGKKIDLLFPADSLLYSKNIIEQSSTEYLETVEIPILARDGEIRLVLWNSANIYDTDNRTIISTIAQGNDITERKKAEQQLEEYAAELKNLNATKDKFFGIIAHDLKNPFSSLLGASELLAKNTDNFDKEKIKYLSEILNDSAQSGYNLLENLLEWSKTQTGNISFKPVSLNIKEIAEKNLYSLKVSASNKSILLQSEIKEDLQVLADKYMLDTVLRNLLINAIKFTNKNGTVSLRAIRKDGQVTVIVKDTGIGIEEENIEKLFKIDTKFFNVGTANERGTGLGLLLCKEFVEKHGGKIWVESEFGAGSEFKFTIPV